MNTHDAKTSPEAVEQVEAYVADHFDGAVEDLMDLVRIPSIAWADQDPAHLERSAERIAHELRESGLDDVQILRATQDGHTGAPAVVARKLAAPGKPTILLYAHHDVQPTGDRAQWDTEPFEPTRRGDRLYGRGAADDKAGVVAHINAFRAASAILGDGFGLGVTFFIEGEEEAGSPTFRAFLEENRELLKADVIVVADSGNWKVGTPALTTSLRGLVDGTVTVRALEHAVHSGMYGGPLLDSLTLASRLIATFHDDDGAVAIEGLAASDDSTLDYPEQTLRADASAVESLALAGTGSLTSRLWTKPALSIIGIDAPRVASSSNTLSDATTFKFSLRIAPGQDPQAALASVEKHIKTNAPFGAEVVFTPGETGAPFKTDTSSHAAQTALEALRAAWGTEPVEIGIGGSIPFIGDLKQIYPHAEILITGVEDPDSRAHSANESLELNDFKNAITAEALLLLSLNAD